MTPKKEAVQAKEQQPPAPILLANDPGASGLRLYGSAGWVNKPAHVASDGTEKISRVDGLGKLPDPPVLIEADTVPPMYVGNNAPLWGRPIENLDHDRQTGTPEMRAVLYAALTEYQQRRGGKLRTPVRMGIALPNQLLSGDGADHNKTLVRRWIEGVHTWRADGAPQRVEIAEAKISSQGAAAMFDFLLGSDGQWLPDRAECFKKEIGVLSFGFDTIEATVIRNKSAYPDLTGGDKLGARRLLELYDPHALTPTGLLEPDLRAGKLDVSNLRPVWEAKVTGFIDRKWGKAWKRFAAIVVVGGGALLLSDLITDYFEGRACVPDEPVLAVSRGLYKLMLNQHKPKEN